MRRLNSLAIFVLLLALPARAERIRVTTWNLHLSVPAAKSAEAAGLATAGLAEFLRSLNSDVLLLQEVGDRSSCESLVSELGSQNYQLLVVSDFPQGASGDGKKKQIAIVSKRPAITTTAEEWQAGGPGDLPGGFVSAIISFGQRNVGFYCVHLKNNSTRGNFQRDNQLNVLKREAATAQLLERIKVAENDALLPLDAIVLGGDFNTSPDQTRFISEQTLGLVREAHLQDIFDGLAASERVTCPGRGRYADVTFDYIFVKNLTLRVDPSISRITLSDHFPVTCELELPDAAPPLAGTATAPPATTDDVVVTPTGTPSVKPPAVVTSASSQGSATWLMLLALLLGVGGFACGRWSMK